MEDRSLFVCETDAQIMNAVNIKRNLLKTVDSDLCLLDLNGRREHIANNIERSNIFGKIYVCHPKFNRNQSLTTKIEKALKYALRKEYPGDFLINKDSVYSEIFIAGPSLNSVGVYYFFRRKNKNIVLSLYEEGVFEYYIYKYKKNLWRRIYSNIVFGGYYIDYSRKIYVYNKELLLNKPSRVHSINIPKIDSSDMKTKALYNDIFGVPDLTEQMFGADYLFIEQAFPEEKENEIQTQILKDIADIVGKNKLVVKLHPHSKEDKYSELGIRVLNIPLSMEMLLLNYGKVLKDCVLLSICSSAVFNCNLVFGLEPKIILLYKLFENITIDKNLFNFITEFMGNYPADKAFLPSGRDDLKKMIWEIKGAE